MVYSFCKLWLWGNFIILNAYWVDGLDMAWPRYTMDVPPLPSFLVKLNLFASVAMGWSCVEERSLGKSGLGGGEDEFVSFKGG